jgi:hypothetical protein
LAKGDSDLGAYSHEARHAIRDAEGTVLTEMVATLSIKWRCRHCPCRREARSTEVAIVPSVGDDGARRDSVQERESDAASCGRLSVERLAERGARSAAPSKGSTAPDAPGGELDSSSSPISRWQHDIDSDRNSGAAMGSVVARRQWCLRDRQLLESRSPRCAISADRR